MATDATGRSLWKESYRPFGERTVNTGSGGAVANANNSLWFTGKLYEPSTGLSYMGARYYAPALGRFIGMDPKEVDPEDVHSFNRYAYANNNPFKYVDPDGRSPVLLIPLVWTVGNAAISGAINAATQYLSTGQVQWRGVAGVLDAAGDGAILGPALGAVSGLAGGSASVDTALPVAPSVGGTFAKSSSEAIHITKDGVALPPGAKHQIPDGYVQNQYRAGSYGEVVEGRFKERLRIDPPTPPGQKGPNYSHYHRDSKGTHYSPKPGDKDPGFDP